MADAVTINKIVGPLIKDLNKYHDFSLENETIDGDESGYAVFFQREGEDPIALSKPSLALFHGDPVLYFEESQKIQMARYHDILNLTRILHEFRYKNGGKSYHLWCLNQSDKKFRRDQMLPA